MVTPRSLVMETTAGETPNKRRKRERDKQRLRAVENKVVAARESFDFGESSSSSSRSLFNSCAPSNENESSGECERSSLTGRSRSVTSGSERSSWQKSSQEATGSSESVPESSLSTEAKEKSMVNDNSVKLSEADVKLERSRRDGDKSSKTVCSMAWKYRYLFFALVCSIGGGLGISMMLGSNGDRCLPGQYLQSGKVCLNCPFGRYARRGASVDHECEGQCSKGYVCHSGSTSPEAKLCSLGHYCADGLETPCPVGVFGSERGLGTPACMGDCQLITGLYCNLGSTSDTLDVQEPCPAGSYCDGMNTIPQVCPGGTRGNETGLIGPECAGPTPEGTYSPQGSKEPILCPRGAYCPSGSAVPILCSNGTFNANLGAGDVTSCEICPAGSWCPSGSESSSTLCPESQFCSAGTSLPGPCQAGFYCPAGSSVPNMYICPAGSWCPASVTLPIPCPGGTYSSVIGAVDDSVCVNICPERYFCVPGTSEGQWIGCPAGYFCPPGTGGTVEYAVNPDTGVVTALSAKPFDEFKCPAGYRNYRTGIHVELGCFCNYTDYPGIPGECECPAGRYCAAGCALEDEISCPFNHYCEATTPEPKPCAVQGYWCPRLSKYETFRTNRMDLSFFGLKSSLSGLQDYSPENKLSDLSQVELEGPRADNYLGALDYAKNYLVANKQPIFDLKRGHSTLYADIVSRGATSYISSQEARSVWVCKYTFGVLQDNETAAPTQTPTVAPTNSPTVSNATNATNTTIFIAPPEIAPDPMERVLLLRTLPQVNITGNPDVHLPGTFFSVPRDFEAYDHYTLCVYYKSGAKERISTAQRFSVSMSDEAALDRALVRRIAWAALSIWALVICTSRLRLALEQLKDAKLGQIKLAPKGICAACLPTKLQTCLRCLSRCYRKFRPRKPRGTDQLSLLSFEKPNQFERFAYFSSRYDSSRGFGRAVFALQRLIGILVVVSEGFYLSALSFNVASPRLCFEWVYGAAEISLSQQASWAAAGIVILFVVLPAAVDLWWFPELAGALPAKTVNTQSFFMVLRQTIVGPLVFEIGYVHLACALLHPLAGCAYNDRASNTLVEFSDGIFWEGNRPIVCWQDGVHVAAVATCVPLVTVLFRSAQIYVADIKPALERSAEPCARGFDYAMLLSKTWMITLRALCALTDLPSLSALFNLSLLSILLLLVIYRQPLFGTPHSHHLNDVRAGGIALSVLAAALSLLSCLSDIAAGAARTEQCWPITFFIGLGPFVFAAVYKLNSKRSVWVTKRLKSRYLVWMEEMLEALKTPQDKDQLDGILGTIVPTLERYGMASSFARRVLQVLGGACTYSDHAFRREFIVHLLLVEDKCFAAFEWESTDVGKNGFGSRDQKIKRLVDESTYNKQSKPMASAKRKVAPRSPSSADKKDGDLQGLSEVGKIALLWPPWAFMQSALDHLVDLKLSALDIQDPTAMRIIQCIPYLPNLRSIDLSKNCMTEETVGSLLQALVGNIMLRRVNCNGNPFCPFRLDYNLLCSVFASNAVLRSLLLTDRLKLMREIPELSKADSLAIRQRSLLQASKGEKVPGIKLHLLVTVQKYFEERNPEDPMWLQSFLYELVVQRKAPCWTLSFECTSAAAKYAVPMKSALTYLLSRLPQESLSRIDKLQTFAWGQDIQSTVFSLGSDVAKSGAVDARDTSLVISILRAMPNLRVIDLAQQIVPVLGGSDFGCEVAKLCYERQGMTGLREIEQAATPAPSFSKENAKPSSAALLSQVLTRSAKIEMNWNARGIIVKLGGSYLVLAACALGWKNLEQSCPDLALLTREVAGDKQRKPLVNETPQQKRAEDLRASRQAATSKELRTGILPLAIPRRADNGHLGASIIDLSWALLTDVDAYALAVGIAQNANLATLDCDGNEIGDQGVAAIACALALGNRERRCLRGLLLGSWRGGNNVGPLGAKAIASSLLGKRPPCIRECKECEKCHNAAPKLVRLDLSNNRLGSIGCKDLLLTHGVLYLQYLALSSNKLGDAGAEVCADFLRVNRTLKILRLSGNEITAKGAASLSDALLENSSLSELFLDWNELDDEGAIVFSAHLAARGSRGKRWQLQGLSLEHNMIGDSGATAVAELIGAQDCPLVDLYLGYNPITDQGMSEIAGLGIARNSSLVTLSLAGTAIGDHGAGKIAQAAASNLKSALSCVDVTSCNQLHRAGIRSLESLQDVVNERVMLSAHHELSDLSKAGLASSESAFASGKTRIQIDPDSEYGRRAAGLFVQLERTQEFED